MKKSSVAVGLACLVALGACSGPDDSDTGKASNEEMSHTSATNNEANTAVEKEGGVAEEAGDAGFKIRMTEDQSDESEHEEEHGHGGHVGISLQNDEVDPTVLITTVTESEQPLTEANVRFEYWKEEEEKHTYSDAEENSEGMYEGATEISDPGTYKLKVHVEKGEELHTHKPYVLEVAEK